MGDSIDDGKVQSQRQPTLSSDRSSTTRKVSFFTARRPERLVTVQPGGRSRSYSSVT